MGHHAEVQYQCKSSSHYLAGLRQGDKCSPDEWQHGRTTVGVRQGCLLSPTFFNIFLERIISDALKEHDGKVSIGGRNITKLRLADDIVEEEQELETEVESLNKTSTRENIEITAEKTKHEHRQLHPERDKGKGQKLGIVTSFKYLGDDGSKPEIL